MKSHKSRHVYRCRGRGKFIFFLKKKKTKNVFKQKKKIVFGGPRFSILTGKETRITVHRIRVTDSRGSLKRNDSDDNDYYRWPTCCGHLLCGKSYITRCPGTAHRHLLPRRRAQTTWIKIVFVFIAVCLFRIFLFGRFFLFPSNTAGSHAATTTTTTIRPFFRLIPQPRVTRYTLPSSTSILLPYRRSADHHIVACEVINSFFYVFRSRTDNGSPVSHRLNKTRIFCGRDIW